MAQPRESVPEAEGMATVTTDILAIIGILAIGYAIWRLAWWLAAKGGLGGD